MLTLTDETGYSSAPTLDEDSVGFTDRHVGMRVRLRRMGSALTQQQFADLISVSYRQACRYERGIDRISAGRLYDMAKVLNTPITWFFDGMNLDKPGEDRPQQGLSFELARNFETIQNEKHRDALDGLARALATQATRRKNASAA